MRIATLEQLCCPLCAGQLAVHKVVRHARDDAIQFGLVVCSNCRAMFPIVARVLLFGTPGERISIHSENTESTLLPGPSISQLNYFLERGEFTAALTLLLTPSGQAPDLAFPAEVRSQHRPQPFVTPPRIPPGWQRRINRALSERPLKLARDRMARILLTGLDSMTATDVIRLYYAAYSRVELANYFTYRFGQPRFLAALTMARAIKRGHGPLLDLACGAGHLTHYLSQGDRQVIGVDRDFMRLFIAANFVAPAADFVAAWADRALPFRDGFFGGVLCSDAFHYFADKLTCLHELTRVLADDGLIAIARAGNVDLQPNEGYELSPAGYSKLCGTLPHTIFGEDELIDAYLRQATLDLSRRDLPSTLSEQKWLSLVLAKYPSTLAPTVSEAVWPHAAGVLGVNPIYRLEGRGANGAAKLRFRFPSEHYAAEDAGYLKYAASEVEVSPELLEQLSHQKAESASDERIERLVRSFVLIGLPKRYMPDPFCLTALTEN